MAKKGRRSAASEAADCHSESTTAVEAPTDPWEQAWDATMESSAASRVKGVQRLCKLLQAGYDIDAVSQQEGKFVDLAESTLSSKRPDKALETAVCQMMALVFLTLGRDCLSAYDSLFELIQERAREGKAKGAAATALACGAVAAGGSDHDRLRALRALAGLWLTHRGTDLEAALRGWTLVLSVVDVRTLSTPLIDATLQHLAQHLAGTNVAVRAAACEALGVLYTECGLEVLPDDDDELLSGDGASASTASLDGSACAVSEEARAALETGFHAVLARIDDLARNRGDAARRSKTERRSSRQSAAATLAAMSSAGADNKPAVVLRAANGRRVELYSLSARLVYRELAAVLASAMQRHVAANPLLHELLGLEDMDEFDAPKGKTWRGEDREVRQSSKAKHKASAARMAAHMMH
eukprot:jgi/Ulvmu1/9576/UM054_0006.1